MTKTVGGYQMYYYNFNNYYLTLAYISFFLYPFFSFVVVICGGGGGHGGSAWATLSHMRAMTLWSGITTNSVQNIICGA